MGCVLRTRKNLGSSQTLSLMRNRGCSEGSDGTLGPGQVMEELEKWDWWLGWREIPILAKLGRNFLGALKFFFLI